MKEGQLGLFAERTRCHRGWPNPLRLPFACLGQVVTQPIRAVALASSTLARTQAETLRVKLLKLGAVIVRNTRRMRYFIASAFPLREIFLVIARRLDTT